MLHICKFDYTLSIRIYTEGIDSNMGKKKKKKSEALSWGSGNGLGLVDLSYLTQDDEKTPKEPNVKGPYNLKEMQEDADNYEKYLDIISGYAILKNVSPDKYEKAVKTIEKLIKLLRAGDGDAVYDRERYEEYKRRMGKE